jgi:hypothetical protein
MSIRREDRGRRRTLTARVATVCTVVAALLCVTAQSASAYVPCPRPVEAAGILNWNVLWPTPGADAKGVTLCHGFGSVFSKGYLQIVDLEDGASLRLVSSLEDPVDRYQGHQQYFKRTADDWYSSIRAGGGVSTPASSLLFSTTNASYFNNTGVSALTTIPFPHRFDQVHETWGTVGYDHWLAGYPGICNGDGTGTGTTSPDVCATKRALHLGDPTSGIQRVGMYYNNVLRSFDWPYSMDAGTSRTILADSDYAWDATIGFSPTYEVGATGASSRRNYLGMVANRVYIFTSDTEYTTAEANAIMQEIYPGMTAIQLDGGGSAQFHSAYGSMDSSIPLFDREVPDVLAIYRAP